MIFELLLFFFVLITTSFNATTHHVFSLKGADMDVCLTTYGHCNYISGKHACIFYDEVCCFQITVLPTCKLLHCTAVLHSTLLNKGSAVVDKYSAGLYPVFRIPSIMSCSTTASMAQRLTTSCIRVTSLRKPRCLLPVASWPRSRALSVSTSLSFTPKCHLEGLD